MLNLVLQNWEEMDSRLLQLLLKLGSSFIRQEVYWEPIRRMPIGCDHLMFYRITLCEASSSWNLIENTSLANYTSGGLTPSKKDVNIFFLIWIYQSGGRPWGECIQEWESSIEDQTIGWNASSMISNFCNYNKAFASSSCTSSNKIMRFGLLMKCRHICGRKEQECGSRRIKRFRSSWFRREAQESASLPRSAPNNQR